MSARPAIVSPEPPILGSSQTYETVTHVISRVVLERRWNLGWVVAIGAPASLLGVLGIAVSYLFYEGVGIWGIDIPVAWAFAITNFVWWIGIGHAGTLISAILILVKQPWRQSISRFAEACTIFAVMCAGLFPLLHLGRPWFFYWLLPYPNTMNLWPQFRSPLVWDAFAVSTYFTISLLFWYVGLIPDLATLRDRASGRVVRSVYAVLALGWRGSARHWQRYECAYLLLAGVATPLVVSVHTIVSFDFSIAQLPGWHSTIFPPYFVAGALYSGFAMVLMLAIPLRAIFGLRELVTDRHFDCMAQLMLASGLVVGYGYLIEAFISFYSANAFDAFTQWDRLVGSFQLWYGLTLTCNCVIPQLLWFRRVRYSPVALFLVSLTVAIGMWLERFVIIVQSLHRDFLPSSWGIFVPTIWDWATLFGSLGLFLTLFVLFVRYLPMISMAEMRTLLHERGAEA